jgi:hypothetical protein
MDNLIAQITALRTSAENTLSMANGVLAAAHSVAGGGAGLPPTAGGGGAAVLEWPEVPSHPPGTAAPAAAAAAAAAALPPPAPITEQLTLGVATPATFGNAETNAQHYLLGKSLYEPTAAQVSDDWTKGFLATAAHDAYTTACGPKESVAAAKAAWASARREANAAHAVVKAARLQMARFQEYYDGTWASIPLYYAGAGAYFIYRFFVFKEIVSGPCTGIEAAHWEPIGLLNPHAYIGSKLMGKRARFLDFIDATQPAPDVAAHWRDKMAGEKARKACAQYLEDEEEEEDDDEQYLEDEEEEEEYEDEDIFRAREVAREHKEEMAFWAERAAALAVRYATPTKPAAAAGGGGGGCSANLAVEWAHAAAKAGGSLAERLAALDAALDAADAAPAVPAGFSPVLDLEEEAALARLDPRAESNAELRPDLWEGRWTTLPDGRRVLIYRHHAFAPPADGSYRTAQPLQHLGFYNFHDRTIDATTTSLPALPSQDAWPF